MQATDGNFYGTTASGGAPHYVGTIFKITIGGTLTKLYSFCSQTNCTDGSSPRAAALLQATNGNLYGTTYLGGGTVFRLGVALGPFLEAVTYSGKVGSTIEFLGQGFTSSTTVSFNGTKSTTVTVKSGGYLTATVPNNATTGFVTTTTSGVTLKSNKMFRVIPQIASFSPTSGSVGTSVIIKGVSLKETTQVKFGGVPATNLTVNSDTQVTVTVPNAAKTGKITVTTPGGTATSSGTFTVT